MPAASTSCIDQASEPDGCTPTARSWTMPTAIPASRAACWAAPSWLSVSQVSQQWKSIRSSSSLRALATCGERGSRSPAGQACQSGPCSSASADQVAWSSSAWPCPARKSAYAARRPGLSGTVRRISSASRLQRPDRVPVDQGVLEQDGVAQGRGAGEQGRDGPAVPGREVGVLGDLLDPQVDGVGEAAGGGAVRRRVGRTARYGGVQRVDLEEAGAEGAAGPRGEVGQVAEVAHAPGARGQRGVELGHEAEDPFGRPGQPGGRDHQVAGGGTAVLGGGP